MTTNVNRLSDLYIILSKGYFVPQVLEDPAPFLEPFQSSFDLFRNAILEHSDDLPHYLGTSHTPFWKKALFVPNIGEISYNHRKNITSRLLIGGTRTDEMYDFMDYLKEEYPDEYHPSYKFTFPSSDEISDTLHLPLLIRYQKKIKTNPVLSSYLGNHGKVARQKNFGISEQYRAYIHFYLYGLCFVHLAISVSTQGAISIDDLISWLRDIKAANPHRAVKVTVKSKGLSFDSIEHFFDYIWGQISKRVFKSSDLTTLTTPIYDSIRIKPLQRANEVLIESFIKANEDKVITEDSLDTFHKFWFVNLQGNEIKFDEALKELERAKNYFPNNASQESELPEHYSGITDEGDVSPIRTYYAKMLTDAILQQLRNHFPINLGLKEIAGLLSKSTKWRTNRANPSEYESAYGRYEGDLILPKSQSTLIVTNIWSRRKQLQLLFQWELIAVSEIAYGEKLIIPYYIKRLARLQKQNFGNSSDSLQLGKSTPSILYSLMKIHQHLAPHFRKWYHTLAKSISLDRRKKELLQHLSLEQLTLRRNASMATSVILFLAADPTDASRLRIGKEFREVQEKLKRAKLRDHFTLELPQLSARPEDISQALLVVRQA